MNVVHLETGRHLYGGARQVSYLLRALAARGIGTTAICSAGSALAAALKPLPGVELIEWPLGGDIDIRLRYRLARWLAARRPDLLHVHSRRGADSFGGRAARAAACPAVLTRRVQSAEPRAWTAFKCAPYAAIASISTAVGRELEDAGIAPARIRHIPSAVDTAAFAPDSAARARLCQRFGLPADALIVATAAQCIPRKGQDRLLPLAAHWRIALPSFRLLLFGQGPTRRALERRAAALGLGDCVHFAGFVPDWPALLPGLDLLLHPARREGLGNVVLEAMSAGVPVVASAVGGIVDVIRDGVDGRLLPPDDEQAWQSAVDSLLRDPERRALLAAAARHRIEAGFTIDAMTDAYLELYRDVLG